MVVENTRLLLRMGFSSRVCTRVDRHKSLTFHRISVMTLRCNFIGGDNGFLARLPLLTDRLIAHLSKQLIAHPKFV